MLVMIALMLPFFLFAMYERDGLPAEKVARNIINALFIRPGRRPYKTENMYAALMVDDDVQTGTANGGNAASGIMQTVPIFRAFTKRKNAGAVSAPPTTLPTLTKEDKTIGTTNQKTKATTPKRKA